MNTLCLVTDSANLNGRSLPDVVRQAIEGGVNMVQLREKNLNTRDFVALAREIKRITDDANIPFLINDRVDIALAVEADGVHLGQTDMPYNIARSLLGRERIIGLSVGNMAQIMAANDLSVDYVAISPLFASPSNYPDSTPCGINGLVQAMQLSLHPVLAVGGVNTTNITEVIDAVHAHTPSRNIYHTNKIDYGVAVVSAIMAAPSPLDAASALAQKIK